MPKQVLTAISDLLDIHRQIRLPLLRDLLDQLRQFMSERKTVSHKQDADLPGFSCGRQAQYQQSEHGQFFFHWDIYLR